MKADRATVLAWMRETGHGHSRAAQRFDLNAETVKSWAKRAAPKPPPKRPHAPEKPPAEPKPAKSTASTAEADRVARARTALAEALGPELREQLRESVRHTVAFLAEPPTIGTDWQQRAHAARTVDILLARVPDIMIFDKATTPAADASATSRKAEITAVFGTPAATVTVLEGGRAADKA